MKKALVLALAAIMVLGVAGAAFADSVVVTESSKGKITNAGPVAVQAKVNPKITLTITTTQGDSTTPLLLAWEITPGVDPVAKTVELAVRSNKGYSIVRTPDVGTLTAAGSAFDFGSTLPETGVKGAQVTHTDTVNLTSTDWWSVEPGDYAGSITYTLAQL